MKKDTTQNYLFMKIAAHEVHQYKAITPTTL